MKKKFLSFFLFVSIATAQAQVTIGSTAVPQSSAVLDLQSGGNKALILPRVPDTSSILAPVAGMQVYCTNDNFVYLHNGSKWNNINGGNTTATGNAWLLTGNSGTTAANFLGTADDVDVQFKRNNIRAGFLSNNNTSFGINALNPSGTGYDNVAIGQSALFSNTTGYGNVAIGESALLSSTTGYGNVAIGRSVLLSSTTAYSNVAIGQFTLQSNTSGNFNTAIGDGSLYYNTIGISNAAIGNFSLSNNTTGKSNTAIGSASLHFNATGNYNTALGSGTDVSAGNLDNITALGYNVIVDASNKVRIGNSSVTSIGGQVGWTIYSDRRVKRDVKEEVSGLTFIKKLRPVTYHYNVASENKMLGVKNDTINWRGKYDIEKIPFSGFIAQEVEDAAIAAGYNFSGIDKSGEIMGLRYSDFVAPMVKAIQEQSAIIEQLQMQLFKQQTKKEEQQNQINQLLQRLEQQEKSIVELKRGMIKQ